ncbi:hypothetical protein ABHZ04_01910, partial [Phocaeicola vulgatus]
LSSFKFSTKVWERTMLVNTPILEAYYSLGVGAKIKMNKHLNLNVGYMWTNYEDYTKKSTNYNGTGLPGTNVYSRTNKVFGLSADYSF